jgi:guanylate kinase
MTTSSKLLILGKGAAGKDHLCRRFEKRGFTKSISYTTRPIRLNEKDGIDYHFISEEQFKSMSDANAWQEQDCFRGWYYGTTKDSFEDNNLFIKTPRVLAAMKPEDRAQCFVIYLNPPKDIIRKRLEYRNDADDVERRIRTDEEAFADFKDYDLMITDPNF